MGVYIKGMEMPKTAFDCSIKVNPEERQCIFTHKTFEETFDLLTERRCEDCPLVEIKEPHGRLIEEPKALAYDGLSKISPDDFVGIAKCFCEQIKEHKTVIKAEDEE